MRLSKEQAAQNRQKILIAATRLFRDRGISVAGVDAITEAAGLTYGAVYGQFGSKEAIAAAAVREISHRSGSSGSIIRISKYAARVSAAIPGV
jgi:TetR/AcrR family transcriptional regulator, transcriptional repressor for nem operon